MAGVALLDMEGHSLAEDPGSNTIDPVVWRRMRSLDDDPLKKRSSCVPAPVETSARTVLLYWPKRP